MRRLALIALAGCAGAEAMTLPPAPVAAAVLVPHVELGLNPGETMAFDVKLAGIPAGEAQLAVGQIGTFEGHRAIVVHSRAETTGAAAILKHLTDEATTTIDADTGRPLQLDTVVELDDKRTTATAKFTGSAADVTFAREGEPAHTYRVQFGTTAALDTHSAMAEIRSWKPAPGASRSVFVIGGRRLWRVDVHYVGDEEIGSVLGNRRAVHFDGSSYRVRPNLTPESAAPSRTFSVWLSDDADRVPLKLVAHTELGDVAMDLTDYARP
jgi:hypothetical protein